MSERFFFSICQSQYRCDATWYPTQSNFSPVAFIFFSSSSYFLCVFFAFCCGLFLPLVIIIAQANVKWLMPHTSFFYAKQMTANIAWRKCTVPKWRFKNSPNHPILFFCFMSEWSSQRACLWPEFAFRIKFAEWKSRWIGCLPSHLHLSIAVYISGHSCITSGHRSTSIFVDDTRNQHSPRPIHWAENARLLIWWFA